MLTLKKMTEKNQAANDGKVTFCPSCVVLKLAMIHILILLEMKENVWK
jgi:hypothetical protein